MSDCVLDASAMVLALSGKTDAASKLRTRLSGVRKQAPHLIDAEVRNVLRRHEREARLSPDEALLALHAARRTRARRPPLSPCRAADGAGVEVAA